MAKIIRKIYKYIINNMKHNVFANYDYAYLSKMINVISKSRNVEFLIVGISYSMFGIDCKNMEGKCINLSLPSQDLFYTHKVVEKISYNSGINYCIIGCAYYSFYFDLSKSTSERYRIDDVYYPIFKDSHNYGTKGIANNKRFNALVSLSKNYFNLFRTREMIGRVDFNKCDIVQLDSLSTIRSSLHNKQINYEESEVENVRIFKKIIEELYLKQIKPIIVIFPVTSFYRKHFDIRLKEIFYNNVEAIFDELKLKPQVIDCFDDDDFDLNDFIDFDHLNKRGAKKMTIKINSYLNKGKYV